MFIYDEQAILSPNGGFVVFTCPRFGSWIRLVGKAVIL